jgi:hypothetical protein
MPNETGYPEGSLLRDIGIGEFLASISATGALECIFNGLCKTEQKEQTNAT